MSRTVLALLAFALIGLPLAVAAQATAAEKERHDAAMARWKAMTPEEQAAAKEKARAKWDSMTPEEQAAAKHRFAERHPTAAARRSGATPVPAPTAASAAPGK
jgi:Ni/Co efflux regulator RcnB